jgi:alkylation response protein AidB-like acyl-CoA dehydrogenase
MTAALEDYRRQVRSWLAEQAPAQGWLADGAGEVGEDLADHGLARARHCQALLFEAGYAGITWPVAYGGQSLSNREQVVFNQESESYDLPVMPYLIGLGMCGPTVLAAGTEEQRERYIRPLLRGEEIWCQMFSEPGAGSDVAGIRSRAIRQEDGSWLVRGHKIWTSGAQYCDFGLLLLRSDPQSSRHAGLTMFIVDMHAPGVRIEPLRQMNGAAGFNEIFFEDVVLPSGATVGEIGGGWRVALITLMNERVAIGAGRGRGGQPASAALTARLAAAGRQGDSAALDAVADVYVREQVLRHLSEAVNEAILAGRTPGPQGSIAKLVTTELGRRADVVTRLLSGARLQAWAPGDTTAADRARLILSTPGRSIAGGTDQIMRNILAERILGLPRDPRPPT